jgi:hypothetical protein
MRFPPSLWRFVFFCTVLCTQVLLAQEELGAWQERWSDLEARDDIGAAERLAGQMQLVTAAGQSVAWRDTLVWERTREVLAGWEQSADLAVARGGYFSLLRAIGEAAGAGEGPLPDEPALREYYQRAMNIAEDPLDEASMLLYLAESALRQSGDSIEAGGRVESWLQQAAVLLADEQPMDAVQTHLARLYERWGSNLLEKATGEESPLSRAVFHYRQILELESSRELYRQAARQALDRLLKPGLRLQVTHRFLPENDIRVTVQARNMESVDLEVYTIPWIGQVQPAGLTAMRESWLGGDPLPEQLRLSRRHSLSQRNRFDWQESEFRLGENFPPGWYRLRVSAEGLVAEDLLLVTPFDVIVMPHDSGETLVWVVETETGSPVPAAEIRLLGAEGEVLAESASDVDGIARFETAAARSWAEVHVTQGSIPALVIRQETDDRTGYLPWIIPASLSVRPGETLDWVMIDDRGGLLGENAASPTVRLPDGTGILPQLTASKEGNYLGSVDLPVSLDQPGPVYLEFPDGHGLLLAHLSVQRSLPLRVGFRGESYKPGTALFLDTAPVRLEITRSQTMTVPVPEYVRVSVHDARRRWVCYGPGESETGGEDEPLFEQILSSSGPASGNLVIELPEFDTGSTTRPLRVRVRTLDGRQLLAEGLFALVPFRTILDIRQSERIINSGGAIRLRLSVPEDAPRMARSREGQLVVYRQTWESRYIHRKKGTPLSEEEYILLPDRSLLGSAKTDFRLLEQGFVREEVRRLDLSVGGNLDIPLQFDRAGYYRIEYLAQDLEVRAEYPQGPLEVWVMPDSDDLRAFRSDKPRLVFEKDELGNEEILLLLDRKEVTALLDAEYKDGTITRSILKPISNAVHVVREPGTSAPMDVFRIVIAGDRRTDFICRHPGRAISFSWELDTDKLTGLNPGTPFSWKISLNGAQPDSPPYVNFYPESAARALSSLFDMQRADHYRRFHDDRSEFIQLGDWLPLYHPLAESGRRDSDSSVGTGGAAVNPSALAVLFPELFRPRNSAEAFLSFEMAQTARSGKSLVAEGTLPQEAGRWRFAVFGTIPDYGISGASWPVSTETPIRISMDAPGRVRTGDRVRVPLWMQNTTQNQETLKIVASGSGALATLGRERDALILGPGERTFHPLELEATGTGKGTLSVKVQGSDSLSEGRMEFEVAAPQPQACLSIQVIPAGNPDWRNSLTFRGWDSGQAIFSSSLGVVLPGIWSALHESQLPGEPLLAALGDWAMSSARHYHGMAAEPGEADALALDNLLQDLRTEDGGWAWNSGHAADPWLSALVLWSLETFSAGSEERFAQLRRGGREYLEGILVEEDISDESRMLALRALAAPDSYGEPARPSRLQARAFLESLHDRDSLDGAGLAMLLQVARAYGFNEEERLLADELLQRIKLKSSGPAEGLWGNSLVYLALDASRESAEVRQALLKGAFAELGDGGVLRSWRQVGGFLNLLAAFLWEGDFMADGQASVAIDGGEPRVIDLGAGDQGLPIFDIPPGNEKGRIEVQVDASQARTPLMMVCAGSRQGIIEIPEFPEQDLVLLREFLEPTLLAGIHRRVIPLDGENPLQVGDTLQVRITLYVDEARDLAEIQFPVPAGTSLPVDGVQYAFEPSTGKAILNPPVLSHHDQPDPLVQVMRMESLASGRHEFILSYRVEWPGIYAFPQSQLFIPKTGEVYSIGQPRTLNILRRKD